MDLKNIDEAELLIEKLRNVQRAKASIEEVSGEDGGSYETFTLIEKDTQIEVELLGLKAEIVECINAVLNDQRDKILNRLGEI